MAEKETLQLNVAERAELLTQTQNHRKLEHLAREIKEIAALYNVGVAVGSTLNFKEVIWKLYKEAGRLIDTSNFTIVNYNPETQSLEFVLTFSQGERLAPRSVKATSTKGLVAHNLALQAPLLLRDLHQTDYVLEINLSRQKNKPIQSWLGVPILNPLLTDETTQGIIATWSYDLNAFSERELWLLSAVGTQAAIAFRNAHLFEASQRRAEEMARLKDMAQRQAGEMAFLNEVARKLSSTLNLEEVLTRLMERVEEMLDVEAGSLLLTDRATGDLVFRVALGDKAKEVKPFRIPRGQGVAGEVAVTGRPLMIADTQQDERHFKKVDEMIDFQTRNILCVPLVANNQVIGVMEVMNKKAGNFTERDQELLISIASYAAIAIENARLHESVLAERDKVIAAEERARKELARDLHDGPLQLVGSITMSLDFSKKALEKDPSLLAKELDYMQELSKRASHQMRTMLFELRPLVLETQGLAAAVEVFLERRQQDVQEKGPKLTLKIEPAYPGGSIPRQDGKVEATIFAIIQETVNNAIKHAEANEIMVILKESPDAFITAVADDGRGFDVGQVMSNYGQRGSLGMINLQERAQLIGGELTLKSAPGLGTRATIYLPKAKEERTKRRNVTGLLSLPPNLSFEVGP